MDTMETIGFVECVDIICNTHPRSCKPPRLFLPWMQCIHSDPFNPWVRKHSSILANRLHGAEHAVGHGACT